MDIDHAPKEQRPQHLVEVGSAPRAGTSAFSGTASTPPISPHRSFATGNLAGHEVRIGVPQTPQAAYLHTQNRQWPQVSLQHLMQWHQQHEEEMAALELWFTPMADGLMTHSVVVERVNAYAPHTGTSLSKAQIHQLVAIGECLVASLCRGEMEWSLENDHDIALCTPSHAVQLTCSRPALARIMAWYLLAATRQAEVAANSETLEPACSDRPEQHSTEHSACAYDIDDPGNVIHHLLTAIAGPNIPGCIQDPLRLLPGGQDILLFAQDMEKDHRQRLAIYFPR